MHFASPIFIYTLPISPRAYLSIGSDFNHQTIQKFASCIILSLSIFSYSFLNFGIILSRINKCEIWVDLLKNYNANEYLFNMES